MAGKAGKAGHIDGLNARSQPACVRLWLAVTGELSDNGTAAFQEGPFTSSEKTPLRESVEEQNRMLPLKIAIAQTKDAVEKLSSAK